MRKIIIIYTIIILSIPAILLSEWSLYDDDSDYGLFHELLYGDEEVNSFEVPEGYSKRIAAGKDNLYFTTSWPSSSLDIVETTLEGDVVNEFTVTAPEELNGMIAYDGEYLWLSDDCNAHDLTLYCFTTDGDNGPYTPIEIDDSYGSFGLECWNDRVCVIHPTISDWIYCEYSLSGELLNEFILPDPPSGEELNGAYDSLAIEPEPDGLIWTTCHDPLFAQGYIRKFTHEGDMVYEYPHYWSNFWSIGGSTIQENIQKTSLGRIKSMFAE